MILRRYKQAVQGSLKGKDCGDLFGRKGLTFVAVNAEMRSLERIKKGFVVITTKPCFLYQAKTIRIVITNEIWKTRY